MARKGDIDSKSVAARVPMEVYLKLLQSSSSNKKTLSSYLCDILTNEDFSKNTTSKEIEEVLKIKTLEFKSLLKEKESENEYLRKLLGEYKKEYNEKVLQELKEYKKKYNEETFYSLKKDLEEKTLKIEQQVVLMKAKEEFNERLERELRESREVIKRRLY